ncbi:hypothetical protein N3K66_008325 [Trichothecium roseum]|uniref:Uncharacterized protein n=1 Tax=Trichothecium roseum TaxID=47278 RepID=A0ACC0UT62_9HYPO|nr:hypothetical protein N3K66_008325 [Trichothecium roseum]
MDPSSEPAKMRTRACITTPDGINWYYEQQRGTGPHHIVLVPDAVGDCHVFDEALPLIARDGGGDGDGGSFTVTTFDNPGFSRSVPAPADACTSITAPKQAAQIVGLLDALGIRTATFWGSSSGGAVAVALSQMFPSRARSVMAHEAPTGGGGGGGSKFFQALLDEPDDAVVADKLSAGLKRMYPSEMEKWEAKGAEFQDRLRANYPRWVRGYTASFGPSVPSLEAAGGPDGGGSRGVPLDWSVGAATQVRMILDGVVAVVKAGVPVHLLPGLHFPFTTDPEAFAEYVVERARQYL